MGIAAALVVSAVIGAVSAKKSAEKQAEATASAAATTETARVEEQQRVTEIEAATKPTELTAEGISFGAQDIGTDIGATSDFLVKKKTSALGTGGSTSGLGFVL